MKEQITTWLFLLLLGSGYNIESVQGQNVINEFPYELSPESYSKWTLEAVSYTHLTLPTKLEV